MNSVHYGKQKGENQLIEAGPCPMKALGQGRVGNEQKEFRTSLFRINYHNSEIHS